MKDEDTNEIPPHVWGARFKKKIFKQIENILFEEKTVPIEVKLHIVQIVVEHMWFCYLGSNYQDPIECAKKYMELQNIIKETKLSCLGNFLDDIADQNFTEAFCQEGVRIAGENMALHLQMPLTELKKRLHDKPGTTN